MITRTPYLVTFLLTMLWLLSSATQAARLSDPGQIAQEIQEKPIRFQTTALPIEGPKKPSRRKKGQPSEETHVLREIKLQGNTVFSTRELTALGESMVGKSVTFKDLQYIAERITEHYLKAGYVLSSAIIPSQDITDGRVSIQVIEGYISQISIEDPDHVANKRIRFYLNQLLDSRPLHRDVLDKNLILIQRLAGVGIQIFFKPSKMHVGASELVVKLTRQKIEAMTSLNNDGTPSVGPWRLTLQGKVNNFTHNDDSLELSGVTTENGKDVRAGFFNYSLPVGMGGTRMILGGNVTKSKPSGNLESQHILSNSNSMQLVMDTPLILRRDELLSVNGGASFLNSISDAPSAVSHYRDKFRTLLGGIHYESSDRFFGSNLVEVGVEYGLRAFGATATPGQNRSQDRGTANFVATNITLSRLQYLEKWLPNMSLFGIIQGQWAGATLLSSKQFGIGGAPYNRSYQPYAVTGDSGVQGRLELRYTQDLAYKLFKNYMLYGYYTYGAVWNRSPSADEDKVTSVPGLGLGIRFLMGKSTSWYMEYGRPLKDVINGAPNKDKFYTGISYYF